MDSKNFYITTAIYYVNDNPHLGHALEGVQADTLARYYRSLGSVHFLSGTDENSLKNVRAAEKEGKPVREVVDRNAQKFRDLAKVLNLSYDDFIRTTEERHFLGAQKLWQACAKDIYKKKYKGLYCVGCEEYYKEEELENGLCPEHKKKPEMVEEENYFFALSKYQKQIKELIESGNIKIIPESRKNEVMSFLNSGVQDICISRSSGRAKGWGVPVPGDPEQIMWVWFDALSNYITALGYGNENEEQFENWWQNGQKFHIIGKGIARFHAVYWIGMLLSAGLKLPDKIFVHGYITSNGQKMSKSLGNIVDPFKLVEKYGTEAVRYFLLREIPSTGDGDFSQEKFEQRYNGDLAGGLGNLLARTLAMANKLNAEEGNSDDGLKIAIIKAEARSLEEINSYKFNEALIAIWDLVAYCNKIVEKEKPWEQGSQELIDKNRKAVGNLLFALKKIGEIVEPFLPGTSLAIADQLESKKSSPLFPRISNG